jgi:hypothetical protein
MRTGLISRHWSEGGNMDARPYLLGTYVMEDRRREAEEYRRAREAQGDRPAGPARLHAVLAALLLWPFRH